MKFRGDHHDNKVCEIMNRELPNVKVPVPRPTRAHTFDFNLTFNGVRLLDGECKETQSQHEKAILVLHSLDQLAYQRQSSSFAHNEQFIHFLQQLDSGWSSIYPDLLP